MRRVGVIGARVDEFVFPVARGGSIRKAWLPVYGNFSGSIGPGSQVR